MRDSVAQPDEVRSTLSPARSTRTRGSGTHLIAEWLQLQQGYLAKYWLDEIKNRVTLSKEVEHLLDRFLEFLTAMIPRVLGYHGKSTWGLWKCAAQLFGALLGDRRGLAAGEVLLSKSSRSPERDSYGSSSRRAHGPKWSDPLPLRRGPSQSLSRQRCDSRQHRTYGWTFLFTVPGKWCSEGALGPTLVGSGGTAPRDRSRAQSRDPLSRP